MEKTIKNTDFDNLVNYITEKSSGTSTGYIHNNSATPTSLAEIFKNNQIVNYNLLEVTEKEVTEPNKVYKALGE